MLQPLSQLNKNQKHPFRHNNNSGPYFIFDILEFPFFTNPGYFSIQYFQPTSLLFISETAWPLCQPSISDTRKLALFSFLISPIWWPLYFSQELYFYILHMLCRAYSPRVLLKLLFNSSLLQYDHITDHPCDDYFFLCRFSWTVFHI